METNYFKWKRCAKAIAFFFLAPILAISQIPTIDLDPDELVCEKRYPGTVVLKKGDTLKGYIKWVNRQANQRRVYFYKDNDPKTKPQHVRGVLISTYTINGQVYDNIEPEKEKSFFDDADVLAIKLLDGGITLYQSYRDTVGLRFKNKNDTNYLDVCRKDSEFGLLLMAFKNGKMAANLSDGFAFGMKYKENMSKLVSDYPELSEKILNKEKGYRMVHRDKIILEYNEWYKNNKTAKK